MKTHAELVACVRRELSMRIAVYPRQVLSSRKSQETADHEIECMRQVLAIIEGSTNSQKQLSMFDEEKEKNPPNSAKP